MIHELAIHIATVDPELMGEFNNTYVHPQITKGICRRCGASVKKDMRKLHRWWHRDLSLGIYAIGSGLRSVLSVVVDEKKGN